LLSELRVFNQKSAVLLRAVGFVRAVCSLFVMRMIVLYFESYP
jgi:hypothetical protein